MPVPVDTSAFGAAGTAVLGLVFAAVTARWIRRREDGTARMREIAAAIREGAMAFLALEYRVLARFVLVVALLLAVALRWELAVAFVTGAVLSASAGNVGMRVATLANVRTAAAARRGIPEGLTVAFRSGAVMGFSVVGLALLGVSLLWVLFGRTPEVVFGFSFGASSVALFARVGGGIYTKAADVGADLVGKVEAGIPEDDPRNPAVIADNVGDNVGDVAGMGADLFESYAGSVIAALALGVAGGDARGAAAAFLLAAVGLVASLLGTFVVSGRAASPQAALNRGIVGATGLTAALAAVLIWWLYGALAVWWAFLAGLVAGVVIGFATEYYTSSHARPTRAVAQAAVTGSGTNIIAGLALGMVSVAVPVLAVGAAILIAHQVAGIFGIALAGVGMLSTLGITLAADTYGPVADNAAGIAEMAGLGREVRARAEALDAVGNTTAAIGKGFAIGSAALTALALMVSYGQVAGVATVNLLTPLTLVGVFLGGMMPFLFSAFAMSAVGRAAMQMVEEVRRQFREIPGLLRGDGDARPDYGRAVAIATGAAIREMVLPGLLAVVVPVVTGFLLGREALAGLLGGSIVTGFLVAVMMANAGGAWDNAKKYIEEGHLGGKGSETHKAAVVGDTVGDPFKDTAGPSLNILLKLMAVIAIVIAPLLR